MCHTLESVPFLKHHRMSHVMLLMEKHPRRSLPGWRALRTSLIHFLPIISSHYSIFPRRCYPQFFHLKRFKALCILFPIEDFPLMCRSGGPQICQWKNFFSLTVRVQGRQAVEPHLPAILCPSVSLDI